MKVKYLSGSWSGASPLAPHGPLRPDAKGRPFGAIVEVIGAPAGADLAAILLRVSQSVWITPEFGPYRVHWDAIGPGKIVRRV